MTKPTPAEHINQMLRRELADKQRQLAGAVEAALDDNPLLRKQAQAAIRRLNKSIALRVSKLLCQHTVTTQSIRGPQGTGGLYHHCRLCKTACHISV